MRRSLVKEWVKKIVLGNYCLYWLYKKTFLQETNKLELKTLSELIALESKGKDELGNVSQVKLYEILEYAKAKVPFYKDLIKGDLYGSFKALPIMDKKFIRRNLNFLVSDDYKLEKLGLRNTGGSTGEPFEFYSDKQAGAYDNGHHWYLYRLMGHSKGEIIVSCGGFSIPEENRCKNIFWRKNPSGFVFGDYAFSALYLDDTNIQLYVDKLLSLKPVILRGYPSFFDRLAVHILTNNIPVGFTVKGVNLTAEMCSEQQRKNIEKAFSTRVFFEYGHTEISMYCFTKDETYIYHSSPIYGYMEILDDDGNDVQQGEIGRVIVTGFNNRGMPFIRYDTGDLARLRYRSNGYVLLDDIAGRTQDFLWTKDMQKVYLTALVFGQHLKAFKNIIKWQLVQNEPGKVMLKIHKGQNYSEFDQEEIIKKFNNAAGFDINFDYSTNMYSTVSGKHMFLVQNYKKSS